VATLVWVSKQIVAPRTFLLVLIPGLTRHRSRDFDRRKLRQPWLLGSFILVGTFWILPVVYFLRFMPLVVRSVQASMEQIDPSVPEAAKSLGAGWWQAFRRVTLPLVWPGAVAGTLLAFVIAMGEYVASVLVFVPNNRPVSIAIASELRDFNLGSAAAYGVILIAFIAVAMLMANRFERRAN
jgi:iron(III) transport system permease protein